MQIQHLFLFGSKSQFDKLCLQVVTEFKKNYPHIRRIYVRAEFPYIDEVYMAYLLKRYDYTYFPERLVNAGKATYVERNYEMIDNSTYCVFYYNQNYIPPLKKSAKHNILLPSRRKSGTKIAYEYATKKKKKIINLYKQQDIFQRCR